MDDKAFETWSDTLDELRRIRQKTVDLKIQQKDGPLSLDEFFDISKESLEDVIQKWWDIEKQSWKDNQPADPTASLRTVRDEMESLIDLELESMERERLLQAEKISTGGNVKVELEKLNKFAADLKKAYLIKIDTLSRGSQKKAAPKMKSAPRQQFASGGGGSGVSTFIMFCVGLALGAGASYHFWTVANDAQKQLQEAKATLSTEKRQMIDGLTILQETYYKLATGKLLNLPQLEAAMKPIRTDFANRRKEIEKDFLKQRENLSKKIPAGDRLDKSLERLNETKAKRLSELDKEEQSKLDSYLKQRQIHKDLMEQKP